MHSSFNLRFANFDPKINVPILEISSPSKTNSCNESSWNFKFLLFFSKKLISQSLLEVSVKRLNYMELSSMAASLCSLQYKAYWLSSINTYIFRACPTKSPTASRSSLIFQSRATWNVNCSWISEWSLDSFSFYCKSWLFSSSSLFEETNIHSLRFLHTRNS